MRFQRIQILKRRHFLTDQKRKHWQGSDAYTFYNDKPSDMELHFMNKIELLIDMLKCDHKYCAGPIRYNFVEDSIKIPFIVFLWYFPQEFSSSHFRAN